MSLSFSLKKSLPGFDLDITLSLKDELLVLFGPSGAGKSMLLKMISGMVPPDEGEVRIGYEALYSSASGLSVPMRKRKVGFLFQDYALFPHMTVFQNIAYGVNGAEKEAGEMVAGLVSVMRLSGLEKRYPHELSGGQKQRTALARTLAAGPRILLLDEPFSALDYQVREKLRADLINIHKLFPVTTIVVTHDLEEAFMLGRRIAVINNGRIEQEGTREEVFYRPATKNVARFMGVKNIFDGEVSSVQGRTLTIKTQEIGEMKAVRDEEHSISPGQRVSLCIRPEEIIVIRPDRMIEGKVQDNILEGLILDAIGKGSTHVLYLRVGSGDNFLKVELPNFVLRKLALAPGRRITVSLKKEDIWVIP